MNGVPEHLGDLVGTLFPGSRIEEIRPLAPDIGGDDTNKVEGYGRPLRVTVRNPEGERRVPDQEREATPRVTEAGLSDQ